MLRHLELLALSLVCFFLISCADKSSESGGVDGYTRSEIFGDAEGKAVNEYILKLTNVCKSPSDGEIYLGSPICKHKITGMKYANTDEPVADGDRAMVWRIDDRFFLLRADKNINVTQQSRHLRDWAEAKWGWTCQYIEELNENPDFD